MSASNSNNATAPRQVACETSNKDHILVDLDVLHLSGTFKEMCGNLGLEEHDAYPCVFPVKTVNSRTFMKVIEWCKEHKDDPEPVIEKDPLTQECVWFTFTDYDKNFFDVPMSQQLELVKAANYLDIPRLYHYACQSIAVWIKGKHPSDVCSVLGQDCDLSHAQGRKIHADNPWLSSALSGARTKKVIFIPNEVLLTIFEKLPREDLERLQLVSTQFYGVIMNSSELSAQQGPRRVVTKLEFGANSHSDGIEVCLRDGTKVACTGYENLAKRLKFTIVQKLRLGGVYQADILGLSALLPIKTAWKDATLEASMTCFPSEALIKFAFTQLLLCKEMILVGEAQWFRWSRAFMRLPGIAACSKLDISGLSFSGTYEIPSADVVEWLEYEAPPETECSEPRQLSLKDDFIRGIDGLLIALKTAFSASTSPKPYIVRILLRWDRDNLDGVLANDETHEVLSIITKNKEVFVERA